MQIDKIAGFKPYLEIDKAKLDDELVQLPMRFWEVSEACQDAALARDQLKRELAEHDARFAETVKAREKVSDAEAQRRMVLDAGHLRLVKSWEEAKVAYDRLDAILEALKLKGRSLVRLVDLYMADYYVPNSAPSPTPAYRRRLRGG